MQWITKRPLLANLSNVNTDLMKEFADPVIFLNASLLFSPGEYGHVEKSEEN